MAATASFAVVFPLLASCCNLASSGFFAVALFAAAVFVVVVVDFSFVHFTDTDLALVVTAAAFFLVVVCRFSAVIAAFFVSTAVFGGSATIVAFFKSIESIASVELFSVLADVVFVVVDTAFAVLVFAVVVDVAVDTVLAVAVAFVVDTTLVVAVATAFVVVVDSVLETATSLANFSSFVYLFWIFGQYKWMFSNSRVRGVMKAQKRRSDKMGGKTKQRMEQTVNKIKHFAFKSAGKTLWAGMGQESCGKFRQFVKFSHLFRETMAVGSMKTFNETEMLQLAARVKEGRGRKSTRFIAWNWISIKMHVC